MAEEKTSSSMDEEIQATEQCSYLKLKNDKWYPGGVVLNFQNLRKLM